MARHSSRKMARLVSIVCSSAFKYNVLRSGTLYGNVLIVEFVSYKSSLQSIRLTWYVVVSSTRWGNRLSTQYNKIQYNSIQYNIIQCNAMQRNTIAIQYNIIQYNHNTLQYDAIRCNAIQYNTIKRVACQHCNTMQYNTLLYG